MSAETRGNIVDTVRRQLLEVWGHDEKLVEHHDYDKTLDAFLNELAGGAEHISAVTADLTGIPHQGRLRVHVATNIRPGIDYVAAPKTMVELAQDELESAERERRHRADELSGVGRYGTPEDSRRAVLQLEEATAEVARQRELLRWVEENPHVRNAAPEWDPLMGIFMPSVSDALPKAADPSEMGMPPDVARTFDQLRQATVDEKNGRPYYRTDTLDPKDIDRAYRWVTEQQGNLAHQYSAIFAAHSDMSGPVGYRHKAQQTCDKFFAGKPDPDVDEKFAAENPDLGPPVYGGHELIQRLKAELTDEGAKADIIRAAVGSIHDPERRDELLAILDDSLHALTFMKKWFTDGDVAYPALDLEKIPTKNPTGKPSKKEIKAARTEWKERENEWKAAEKRRKNELSREILEGGAVAGFVKAAFIDQCARSESVLVSVLRGASAEKILSEMLGQLDVVEAWIEESVDRVHRKCLEAIEITDISDWTEEWSLREADKQQEDLLARLDDWSEWVEKVAARYEYGMRRVCGGGSSFDGIRWNEEHGIESVIPVVGDDPVLEIAMSYLRGLLVEVEGAGPYGCKAMELNDDGSISIKLVNAPLDEILGAVLAASVYEILRGERVHIVMLYDNLHEMPGKIEMEEQFEKLKERYPDLAGLDLTIPLIEGKSDGVTTYTVDAKAYSLMWHLFKADVLGVAPQHQLQVDEGNIPIEAVIEYLEKAGFLPNSGVLGLYWACKDHKDLRLDDGGECGAPDNDGKPCGKNLCRWARFRSSSGHDVHMRLTEEDGQGTCEGLDFGALVRDALTIMRNSSIFSVIFLRIYMRDQMFQVGTAAQACGFYYNRAGFEVDESRATEPQMFAGLRFGMAKEFERAIGILREIVSDRRKLAEMFATRHVAAQRDSFARQQGAHRQHQKDDAKREEAAAAARRVEDLEEQLARAEAALAAARARTASTSNRSRHGFHTYGAEGPVDFGIPLLDPNRRAFAERRRTAVLAAVVVSWWDDCTDTVRSKLRDRGTELRGIIDQKVLDAATELLTEREAGSDTGTSSPALSGWYAVMDMAGAQDAAGDPPEVKKRRSAPSARGAGSPVDPEPADSPDADGADSARVRPTDSRVSAVPIPGIVGEVTHRPEAATDPVEGAASKGPYSPPAHVTRDPMDKYIGDSVAPKPPVAGLQMPVRTASALEMTGGDGSDPSPAAMSGAGAQDRQDVCVERSLEELPPEFVDREALKKDGSGLPGHTQEQVEATLKGRKFQEYPAGDGRGTLLTLADRIPVGGYALAVQEYVTSRDGIGAHAFPLRNVGGEVWVYDTVDCRWYTLAEFEQLEGRPSVARTVGVVWDSEGRDPGSSGLRVDLKKIRIGMTEAADAEIGSESHRGRGMGRERMRIQGIVTDFPDLLRTVVLELGLAVPESKPAPDSGRGVEAALQVAGQERAPATDNDSARGGATATPGKFREWSARVAYKNTADLAQSKHPERAAGGACHTGNAYIGPRQRTGNRGMAPQLFTLYGSTVPDMGPRCGQYDSIAWRLPELVRNKTISRSMKRLVISDPALNSYENATANHPYGYGGGTLWIPRADRDSGDSDS
jgi:hypothetical protein